jgi:uncharacterized Zn finger protein
MGRYDYYGGWAPYVPVAERRRQAEKKIAALKKKGRDCQSIAIEGRAIARSFWGKAWCDNLEAYSDYANRLPRGRTYVRNGSVVDLQIAKGKVTALVMGSELYEIDITVNPLEKAHWQSLLQECAGKVSTMVELLQGKLSKSVMEIVTRHGGGLFPMPKQIKFRCSCPDSAFMCKHIAATLYGVGARLDAQPELLFQLRHVDPQELIMQAASLPVTETKSTIGESQRLETADLSGLFGIELDEVPAMTTTPQLPSRKDAKSTKPAAKSAASGKPKPAAKSRTAGVPKSTSPTARASTTAKKKTTTPRAKRATSVTSSNLIARGVPRHMLRSWLDSGVLLRTDERGVYGTTKQTEERIEEYLNRDKPSRKGK